MNVITIPAVALTIEDRRVLQTWAGQHVPSTGDIEARLDNAQYAALETLLVMLGITRYA